MTVQKGQKQGGCALDNQLNLNNLDKSDWKTYRFDEIAQSISERIDPTNTDLEVYVGLEHIDSESIHLKRHGKREDVKGQKLRFYPGDVIFGRRRAYQRKAAVATMDGFCSAHALVLRANPDVIDPELFPFFLHSDLFMDKAVDISVGSLSPTINWGALKKQEFILPPLNKQSGLVLLFQSVHKLIKKEEEVLQNIEIHLSSFLWQIFTSHISSNDKEIKRTKSLFQTRWEERLIPKEWRTIKLKEVISFSQNGFAEGKRDESGVPQLRMNNVTRDGRIDLTKIAMIPIRKNQERYTISEGDVLFCNTNSEDLVGKSIIATEEISKFTFSNHFTKLKANEMYLTQKFLYLWLKFHFDIGLFERLCTRWIGQAAVQTESLLRLQIILPPIDEQDYANKYASKLECQMDELKLNISRTNSLSKSLINQVF